MSIDENLSNKVERCINGALGELAKLRNLTLRSINAEENEHNCSEFEVARRLILTQSILAQALLLIEADRRKGEPAQEEPVADPKTFS